MKLRHLALLIPITAGLTLTACGGSDDPDPIEEATKRCQDTVSDYAKYPDTANWGDGPSMAQYSESSDTEIVISGTVNLNNDGGQPVKSIYRCTLDTEADDWAEHPFLEPKRSAYEKMTGDRWGGATSPMREQYGDDMMNEYTNNFGRNWRN